MGKPRYEIREICGDWALDIPPYGSKDTEKTLLFNSRSNADLVKAILEWEDAHPNKAVPYPPTLTPPNEWVSVEERLPEPTYCALVYTTDYSIEVDAIGSDGEWMSFEVTHWMSLPEPPYRRPLEGEANGK